MRLFVDTQTGLATVDGHTDFKRLDAVIIGQGALPEYIGRSDNAYIWIFTYVLEQLLDLQSEIDRDEFCQMIGFARSNKWLQQTEEGEQVRVHVVEWIATDRSHGFEIGACDQLC